MINKVAEQVKEAEVRGVMAAFVDAGLVKVATQNDFDNLCDVVAGNIGNDYDLEKIAQVTEAALSGGIQKVAHETARNAALGELFLMKTAGQIDDATFRKEAAKLLKMAAVPGLGAIKAGLGAAGKGTVAAGRGVWDVLTAKQLRDGLATRAKAKTLTAPRGAALTKSEGTAQALRGLAQTGATYGGLAASGLGAKALYDKYANPGLA